MELTDPNTSNFSSVHSPYACTQPDGNDLFRQHHGTYPSYDPENSVVLEHLCDGPTFQCSQGSHDTHLAAPRTSYFAPFLNATVWRLMGWFYNGSTQKSLDDLNHLVHNVILAEDFDHKDLRNFSAQQETRRLDEAPQDPLSSFFTSDGWRTTSIPI